MIKIYSKVQEGLLLHIVFELKDFKEGRQDLIEADNFLQCSAMLLQEKKFRPHYHKFTDKCKHPRIPQEAWVVISGIVKCSFYDIDNTLLQEVEIASGDASFTLYGGHTYEVITDDTLIYELKTGPYYGQSEDKVFID